MNEINYEKYAKLIADRSLVVTEGMSVMIMGTVEAKPLMLALQKEILQRNAFPYLQVSFVESNAVKYLHSSDEQLIATRPMDLFATETFDAMLLIHSDGSPDGNSEVDMHKQMLDIQSMYEPMQNVMSRASKGEMKWSSCIFPSVGLAKLANMDVEEFENMIFESIKINDENPVESWENLKKEQQILIDYLKDKDEVRIIAEETDLKLSIKGRTWLNATGNANLPDGEIYTGPIEDSVNGHIYFKHPIMYKGNIAEGVRMWFENGKCVKATADSGEEFVNAMLAVDDGSSYVGEFAFGMNEGLVNPSGHILIDEKMAGTIHIAIGNGYPQTGSSIRSAVHWDFICDLREYGQVIVDSKVVLKNGKITL